MSVGRILIVSGGTGGHIFPAAAFGKWVSRSYPETAIDYVCGARPLELEMYRSMDIEPIVLNITGSPIGAPAGKKISRSVSLMRSLFDAGRLLRELKPDICLAFGGYISAPFLFRARTAGLPSVIHEQNAYAGRVTRAAVAAGVEVATGWESCEPLDKSKYVHVGIPTRVFRATSREEAWKELGLPGNCPEGPVLVMMSGSLGSAEVGEVATKLASLEKLNGWFLLAVDPQCDTPEMVGKNICILPGSWDASPFFSIADVAVTRGGASTLAEVISAGIPSVSIPWREAANDHQYMNVLAASGDAKHLMWDERTERIEDLAEKLNSLYRNYPVIEGNISKNMYNDNEKICEKLWNMLTSLAKGEVRIGGR